MYNSHRDRDIWTHTIKTKSYIAFSDRIPYGEGVLVTGQLPGPRESTPGAGVSWNSELTLLWATSLLPSSPLRDRVRLPPRSPPPMPVRPRHNHSATKCDNNPSASL